eukprot:m.262572 g.262572  ORF g.262572 m.262572 type:complete len:251 (+) comp22762_c2_seq5:112-864(+)
MMTRWTRWMKRTRWATILPATAAACPARRPLAPLATARVRVSRCDTLTSPSRRSSCWRWQRRHPTPGTARPMPSWCSGGAPKICSRPWTTSAAFPTKLRPKCSTSNNGKRNKRNKTGRDRDRDRDRGKSDRDRSRRDTDDGSKEREREIRREMEREIDREVQREIEREASRGDRQPKRGQRDEDVDHPSDDAAVSSGDNTTATAGNASKRKSIRERLGVRVTGPSSRTPHDTRNQADLRDRISRSHDEWD